MAADVFSWAKAELGPCSATSADVELFEADPRENIARFVRRPANFPLAPLHRLHATFWPADGYDTQVSR